jgi:uncharacterized lipoprotein NlpE involved in copper resistance
MRYADVVRIQFPALENTMNRLSLPSALLIVAIVSSTAAAQTAKSKLVGTWIAALEPDEVRLTKMFQDSGLNAEQIAAALALVRTQFSGTEIKLTFNADGTSSMAMKGLTPEEQKDAGKWEVTEEAGNKVKLKSTDAKSNVEMLELEFSGNDAFTLTVKKLSEAPIKRPVFKREKKQE